MKIVLFPGVAINNINKNHRYFLDQITSKLKCDGEIMAWEVGHGAPVFNLPLKTTREFLCKVILDFQTVVVHALELKVPQADIYMGHSAGSIIALAQKNSNCVTFGSPATLIECIRPEDDNVQIRNMLDTLSSRGRKVLNIINKYDVIAYPINKPNVENFEFCGNWFNPMTYFPVATHLGYWRSDRVINKIVKTIKNW